MTSTQLAARTGRYSDGIRSVSRRRADGARIIGAVVIASRVFVPIVARMPDVPLSHIDAPNTAAMRSSNRRVLACNTPNIVDDDVRNPVDARPALR
jgi:hypothetical protein